VSVAVEKIEGVELVKVSLNEGIAYIKLKSGNKVTVEEIVEVIRDNGFTPKGTKIRVAGKVVERGGDPALDVTGLDFTYLLVEHPEGKGKVAKLRETALGKQVILNGHLSEREPGRSSRAPHRLQVLDFTVANKGPTEGDDR
jgi:copper chaperone CopZ